MSYNMVFSKENLKAIKRNEKEVLVFWAEYQKVKAPAWAEYQKVKDAALEVFLDKTKKIIERDREKRRE